MDVDAWNLLADGVVAGPDNGFAQRMRDALIALGLTDTDRVLLTMAAGSRQDPAGWLLHTVAEYARRVPDKVTRDPPTLEPAARDRAIDAAAVVAADPASVFEQLSVLQGLPPERAGRLVGDLVSRSVAEADPVARRALLSAATAMSDVAPMSELPVAEIVLAARPASRAERGSLATILRATPRERLIRGLATALQYGPHPSIPELVEEIARPQGTDLDVDVRINPTQASVGSPPSAWIPDAQLTPLRWSDRWRNWRWRRRQSRVDRIDLPSLGRPIELGTGDDTARNPFGSGDDSAPDPFGPTGIAGNDEVADAVERTAYARIDLDTGTGHPDVVLVDRPFTVTVGLGARPSFAIVSTGGITVTGDDVDLDLVLVYDPMSLTPSGPTRHTLTVSADHPYPAVAVSFTAKYLEDASPTRRIGVHYLVDGQVVGIAWRSFQVVDEPDRVADAPRLPAPERALLDLRPLVVEDAPDLVLAVVASDTSADRWIWTAYAADPTIPIPDAPNTSTLDATVTEFALATRRAVQFSGDPVSDYFTLAGRAKRIGASMPAVAHQAITSLLTQEGRTQAPSVLLLTEELIVPWELATLSPPVTTPWGGHSPFLGAHVAIGRWPLTEHKPRPVPRNKVAVHRAAVVTADYTGVPGWTKLTHALAEAAEIAALFTPPADRVEPDLLAVIGLLRGTPAADIVHVALHGQFDQEGDQEGIVLVRRTGNQATAQFLTALQVENGDLARGPFVFLNACQVGSDKRVLGSYGGFASTLLRIGAAGVVAPLWNVDDDIAASVAHDFYAGTLGENRLSVAEAMRHIRTAYTEEAVTAGTPGITATLVAFQVFGHPHLRLIRPN